MTDHQHVGGSRNSNINVKRDAVLKPGRNDGQKKENPKYKNFEGKPIE